jgi:hypothetical protein
MTHVTERPRLKYLASALALGLSACAPAETQVHSDHPTSFAALTFAVPGASASDIAATLAQTLRQIGMQVHRADTFPNGYLYVLAERLGSAEFVGTPACYRGGFNLEEKNWHGRRALEAVEHVRQALQARFGQDLVVYADRHCQNAL